MITPLRVEPFLGNDSEGVPILSSNWSEEDEKTSPTSAPIGVHSIQYTQRTAGGNKSNRKYDGIYLHHGFGASSLSWLPVLPSLVERLGNGRSRGVAHDFPGFGLTDRPNVDHSQGLEQYSFENNVGIGLALLQESLPSGDAEVVDASLDFDYRRKREAREHLDETSKSIAIFGHSMGSKAALLMAHQCASHPKLGLKPNLVVLVAPALEGVILPSRGGHVSKKSSRGGKSQSKSWFRQMAHKVWITWRKLFLDYPFQYGLRRLVCSNEGFWRKGLSLAWGDASRLTDSDILRFQWPSIGKGWEEGLINFTRARLSSPFPSMNDDQLLREVSNLKDTRVIIIYGTKDGVVRINGAMAEKLKEEYPKVKIVGMEGLGHDPFEENVDGFLKVLENALKGK